MDFNSYSFEFPLLSKGGQGGLEASASGIYFWQFALKPAAIIRLTAISSHRPLTLTTFSLPANFPVIHSAIMHPLIALFLGVVQGITEFLPISSSAHLALLEHYLQVDAGGLGFDILLHVGTLVALVAYFYQDWLDMAHAFISPSRYNRPERKMLFFIIVATIPGALAGMLLEKKAETIFREPARIAILLGAVGLLLILARNPGPA